MSDNSGCLILVIPLAIILVIPLAIMMRLSMLSEDMQTIKEQKSYITYEQQEQHKGYEIVKKYYYINDYGNEIYCIEIIVGGEMLQRKISKDDYNSLQIGDYWED